MDLKKQHRGGAVTRPNLRRQGGFFTMDIALAVIMLGLLAGVFQRGASRATLREQAADVKADLVALHTAMEKVDRASAAPSGVPVAFASLQPHLKPDSRLAKTGKDSLGHAWGTLILGKPPQLSRATATHFESVVDEAFWKPYQVEVPTAKPVP